MGKPYKIIKIDKYTGKIKTPSLLLMTRSFQKIGKISRFDNWNVSLVGNGINEICFDVHKYTDGILCPVWDDLIDLKIVDVSDLGKFEISVNYTDSTETVKSIHGFSLETELAQISLYEFHVNDEEAADMEITEYSKDNYDSEGNFIPTTFYREIYDEDSPEVADFKRKHSLLHRVLADKAPHWSIGYVTPYIALDEESQPEESSKFQRTYTADGDTIYDFLTGTVAEESSVVFVFDTTNRQINCYSLCDCIDQKTGKILAKGIGEDTMVLISKNKLANEFNISSNKDNVKNCFRVEGGDDVITDMVRAVNMNGSNYIFQLADFQYQDMPKALVDTIERYNKGISEQESVYYGNGDMDAFLNGTLTLHVTSELEAAAALSVCKNNRVETKNAQISDYSNAPYWYIVSSNNSKELRLSKDVRTPNKTVTAAFGTMGIFPRLCAKYDELSYFESSMMPDTSISKTTAQNQYRIMVDALTKPDMSVGVSCLNNYDSGSFAGISNNIESMANILIDARYKAEVIKGSASFRKNETDGGVWTGNIRITRASDETDYYPKTDEQLSQLFHVRISDDELTFTRQKIEKALHKGSMLDIDFDVAGMNEADMRKYFNKYGLNRLQSFYDGYNSCLSILMQMDADSSVRKDMYEKYYKRMQIISNPPSKENPNPVPGVMDIRKQQVSRIKEDLNGITAEQAEFQKTWNFQDFLEKAGKDFYKIFCSYRREDSYVNNNYISDGLTTAECLAKAKELLEAAEKEAKKACVLQRTVSTSLNNLFAIPEFEPLYDKFALFNYIRVRTEDEVLKLRLIGIEFNGDSAEQIEVTFSDQIESIDGTMSDLQSIIKQAGSMATSYPSTVLQAKQGADASEAVSDMFRNGLNAAKTMLANNDDNEITISKSGIIGKRMDDEGFYGEKQVRITGNIMAFTDDGWKSVRMAIGEMKFRDETTNSEIHGYGIVAENLVGKMIVGDKLLIGNKSNNVLITGNGITIKNGLIQSANYKAGTSGSMLDLTNGTFDYAGGNLTYKDKKLFVKGEVTASKLTATNSGKIANFNISKDELYTDGAEFDNTIGSYFGNSGLRIGESFKVNNKGNIAASSGLIGGWNISDGKISCVDDYERGITLNSLDKSIMSKSNDNEVILKSDYLGFRKNSVQYVTLRTTFWEDKPTVFGVGINSEAESKFISFGNKKLASDKSYITPLVLNYGLNPGGDSQDVLIYGSALINGETTLKNKLFFGNGSSYLWYTNTNSIFCSGRFGVNGAAHNDYDFFVNGTGYNSGNFRIGGNLDIGGELIAHGSYANESTSSTPNLRIGSECHIRKTAGSSLRFKEMIEPICSEELNPDKLYDIEIVQYQFKQDYLSKSDQRYGKEVIGFIAEDVYKKYPIAADCSVDENGNTIVEDWNFRYMVPAMLKLIQKQKDDIDALNRKLDKIIAGNVA